MWTFRLRLHMNDGHDLDLFGAEETLERFRAGLARLMCRGEDDVISILSNHQARAVCVGCVDRIGDLHPVIPEVLCGIRPGSTAPR